MKKITLLLILTIGISAAFGQNKSLFPDGFHIGITGEGNLAQRMTVVAIGKNFPAPISEPTLGWKAGVEFSYHFAKYYGVSIGIDYGTVAQYRIWQWDFDGWMPIGPGNARYSFHNIHLPIKVEFHYPIMNSNFFFYGAAGVNLLNIRECIMSKILGYNPFNWHIHGSFRNGYEEYIEDSNGNKIRADVQLNLGFYYRLPYNDLIRFSFTANYATKDTFHGNYIFHDFDNAYGAYSYRHNHIGFELAYIHCFKKKAKESRQKKSASDFKKTAN